MLTGRNVALAVTGSIAAVRTVELAHELRRKGADVRAITTTSAESIINPWALEFATAHPVVTEITGGVEHVELCGHDGWADVLLIAPATANTIAKLATAIDDTPVTTCATTAIGADLPVVIAPAMHDPMYDHPGVLEAIDQLESWGIHIVPPRLEEGKAKIAAETAIISAAARATNDRQLAGYEILVTSGATRESVDPVRVLTNRSSGKMGRSVAKELYIRGADVTLIHNGSDVPYATVKSVETADEMRDAALEYAADADALISAAAIGDFQIDAADHKLDSREPTTITLTPGPKLIDAVRETAPDLSIVGFKAEHGSDSGEMTRAAQSLLDRVEAAFVVANDASVMGEDRTRAMIVGAEEVDTVDGSKAALASHIADRLRDHLME